MKYTLISIFINLLAVVPLSAVRAMASAIGTLSFWLNPEIVKVTRRNIELCYPNWTPSERDALCKQSVLETAKVSLEVFLVWKKREAWLQKHTKQIINEDCMTSAVAENRGVILLAPHIGNWEVLGKIAPKYGPSMNLYSPPSNPAIEKIVKQSREASGATLVPTNNRGIAKLLKHLKSGGITGILPDQVPAKASGEYAPFFGVNALTMTLLHGLITRTGCKVVVGAAIRVKDGFAIHFVEPDPDIYSNQLENSLLGLNKSVERAIALSPAQWQWEYKRFKRQPTKAVSYYDF